MKRLLFVLILITINHAAKSQLVITEIMYNDGGITDSLEFIEITNNGKDSVLITDYLLKSRSVNYKFPEKKLKPGGFITVCKFSNTFKRYFGFQPYQWITGGLNNNLDSIVLISNSGDTIDVVNYLEDGEWPSLADGKGYSLSLCDPSKNNNIGLNWQANPVYSGFKYNGNQIHANPGKQNYCIFDIKLLKQTDGTGNLIYKNRLAFVDGTVCGINFNPSGLQFSVIDHNNEGVWTFSNKSFGYNFHEGDKIELWGKLEDFNSLGQIYLDSVVVIKTENIDIVPEIVTSFMEEDEGNLIKIENVKILNFSQWTNAGSAFNVEVTNQTDTFSIRIDKDTDIFGKPAPGGTFSITGILGQYDKTSPFLDGYQLYPRYTTDFSPFNTSDYPFKSIGEMTKTDASGVAISKGAACELRGIVYGINLRPNGLQFTIIDNENNGIGVFSSSKKYDYTVKEGDLIAIRGKIDQFNGLLQIVPDTLLLLGQNNSLVSPSIVQELNENSESQLIKIIGVTLKDPSQWKGTGESVNITVTNGTKEFLMRIDNDCELSTKPAPDFKFNLTGLGGQFDSSSPFLEGYQIFPRYSVDIEKTSSILDQDTGFIIYPNPATDKINFYNTGNAFLYSELISFHGVILRKSTAAESFDISDLPSGIYLLKCYTDNGLVYKKVIKK
ncbi:MAG: lamin tail domain-containing protein [Deltaproteobacteria bacterium]